MFKTLLIDFLNKGALIKKSSKFNFFDFIKISLPNFAGGLVTFTDLWPKITELNSAITFLLKIVILIFLIIYIIFIICAKEKKAKNVFYKYEESIRLFFKLSFLPYLIGSFVYIILFLPNGLIGIYNIKGHIFEFKTNEVYKDGNISILDENGKVVSKHTEPLDSEGFFFSDLDYWASRPAYIEFSNKECGRHLIPIDGDTINGNVSHNWYINCGK